MPTQQTSKQVRIIDPILSSVVRGYKHAGVILTEAIFPSVFVAKRGGNIIEFDKTDFRQVTTVRAPGARVGEVQFGHVGKPYSVEDHALAAKVPQEHVQEAAGTPAANQMGIASQSVMTIMQLNLERDQTTLATTADNYAAGNKVTLAGANKWSDTSSDIIGQVEDWKAAVRAKIGMDPNTMVLPFGIRRAIRKHTQLTESIKYTRGGFPSMDQLRDFFELDRIFISKAMTSADGSTLTDVWGKFGWVGFVEPNPSTAGLPSFGYTYTLIGHPSASEIWFDRDTKSWKADVEYSRTPTIAGADAGYLVSDIIA